MEEVAEVDSQVGFRNGKVNYGNIQRHNVLSVCLVRLKEELDVKLKNNGIVVSKDIFVEVEDIGLREIILVNSQRDVRNVVLEDVNGLLFYGQNEKAERKEEIMAMQDFNDSNLNFYYFVFRRKSKCRRGNYFILKLLFLKRKFQKQDLKKEES